MSPRRQQAPVTRFLRSTAQTMERTPRRPSRSTAGSLSAMDSRLLRGGTLPRGDADSGLNELVHLGILEAKLLHGVPYGLELGLLHPCDSEASDCINRSLQKVFITELGTHSAKVGDTAQMSDYPP